jgi:hypothetical protein
LKFVCSLPPPCTNEFVPFLLLLLLLLLRPVLSLYVMLCGGWIIATFEEMRLVLGFEIYPGACLCFLRLQRKKASMQGKEFCNLKENKHNNFYCY